MAPLNPSPPQLDPADATKAGGRTPTVLSRSLAYLYSAGATLAAISLALPHPARQNDLAIAAIVGAACIVGVALIAGGRRLPRAAFHVLVGLGTALITTAVYFSGDGSSPYALYYIWVGVYVFYFFATSRAIGHSLLVGAAYAGVLAFGVDATEPIVRWLLTMGTLLVAGTLIGRLSERVRERATEAARRAERLRAAEAHMRAIIDTANDAFVAMDAGGAIIGWNPQAETTFGWSRARALRQPLFDLIVPARFRRDYQDAVDRFLATGKSPMLDRRIELLALHRDGHEFPTEVTIAAITDNESVSFNAFIHDISDRKLVEAEVRARAEDMAVVARVARDLAGVTDAHAARSAICEAALDVAGCKLTILFEPEAHGRELVSTAIVGGQVATIRLPFAGQSSGAGVAFTSGQPFFVADLAGHPAVAQHLVEELGVASALWQPVLRNGLSIGVLTLTWEQRVEEVPERLSSLMSLLASEAAVAIDRSDLLTRLEAVARTDDLTGLANRRSWDEELPRELARARRDERPLCVAMIDLDHFKDFNDEHGHQAGDRLLKQLAAMWREVLRPTDVLARYGGEEFVVLLPNCELERAVDVIERLREAIPAQETCSAGLAVWDGDEPPAALVSRADAALYRAKREGRDRTIAATQGPTPG